MIHKSTDTIEGKCIVHSIKSYMMVDVVEMNSNNNSIKIESTNDGIEVKATKEILITYVIKLRVALDNVNNALPFNCISALNIKMIREKILH
ncbi:hypothetical protein TSUD_99090 [Trifolium subterraneum]|uniref:Uncharacterized protein n=1 Tax=Trifolium subterraneum TaxID=3900 RepID=A0A2Z6P2R7_TRISU|nr:hypothetical protein TSUD_99090 [Trifolium subterraneum]